MGSHTNFRYLNHEPSTEQNATKQPETLLLSRQPSIYSLTFDEFQNTWGVGLSKDFGSMNMDELLKNIWTAEENQLQLQQQAMATPSNGAEGDAPVENLQRQGSLTLPRTLSQRTVDEVWRDLFKEGQDDKDAIIGGVETNLPQRQRTLGEMTLEEFLVRAGVVREETHIIGKPNDNGFQGDMSQFTVNGLTSNAIAGNHNVIYSKPGTSTIDVTGKIPLPFSKPANVSFTSAAQVPNIGQMASPWSRGGLEMASPSLNKTLVQGGHLQAGGMCMEGLSNRSLAVPVGSPANLASPDVASNGSADTSSLSPVPYLFGRGRRSNATLEKALVRRQRRMIKNRESAARSRARKQAYTLELEEEISKLKAVNQELRKKQAEFMEMQKNQLIQKMKAQWSSKKRCLRRTLTGPW